MSSSAVEMVQEDNKKLVESEEDPKPNIPLRQRRLPASFWQEPSISQSLQSRDVTYPTNASLLNHQFPIPAIHPWTVNTNGATLPVFLPQRVLTPTVQHSNSVWMRNPATNCCTCATCLNFSYIIPRVPETYTGFRYPQIGNPSCCPTVNCIDQGCKLCSSTERWHPERLRHIRLRAARYNAILD